MLIINNNRFTNQFNLQNVSSFEKYFKNEIVKYNFFKK